MTFDSSYVQYKDTYWTSGESNVRTWRYLTRVLWKKNSRGGGLHREGSDEGRLVDVWLLLKLKISIPVRTPAFIQAQFVSLLQDNTYSSADSKRYKLQLPPRSSSPIHPARHPTLLKNAKHKSSFSFGFFASSQLFSATKTYYTYCRCCANGLPLHAPLRTNKHMRPRIEMHQKD